MFNLGAAHVTCLHIGEEWKSELEKVLQKHRVPNGFYSFVSGSTINLPFNDGEVDFMASNGVLMHLETKQMAADALKELTRVTKVGGTLYSHIGIDKPGIVDRYIVKALRAAYVEDHESRSFIDEIAP
jgi:ubiquinone/menaquinone biosynthesis C-methylase UbiE